MPSKRSGAAKTKADTVPYTQRVEDFLANFPLFTTIDLSQHESKATPPAIPGGHTLSKHVGVKAEILKAVWETKPSTKCASSFYDADTAHAAITQAVASRFDTVLKWALDHDRPMCTIKYQLSYPIGIIILKDNQNVVHNADQVSVTFFRDNTGVYAPHNGILTAYPILEDLS